MKRPSVIASMVLLTVLFASSMRALAEPSSVQLPEPTQLSLDFYVPYPGNPSIGGSCATQADGSVDCVQYGFGPLISSVDVGCQGATEPFVHYDNYYGSGGLITISLNGGQKQFTGTFTSGYFENNIGCGTDYQILAAGFTLGGYTGVGTLSGFFAKYADDGTVHFSGTLASEPGTLSLVALGMVVLGSVGLRKMLKASKSFRWPSAPRLGILPPWRTCGAHFFPTDISSSPFACSSGATTSLFMSSPPEMEND